MFTLKKHINNQAQKRHGKYATYRLMKFWVDQWDQITNVNIKQKSSCKTNVCYMILIFKSQGFITYK